MEVSIDIKELRKRKIFVATPMYGGMCGGQYTKSTADLATMCTKYGVELSFFYLFNESLITRARNYLVDEFLRSKCTHLMFIDADIEFYNSDGSTSGACGNGTRCVAYLLSKERNIKSITQPVDQ